MQLRSIGDRPSDARQLRRSDFEGRAEKAMTKMTTIDDTMAASRDDVDLKEKLPWTIDR
jgi:hypothetical protein